MLKLNAAVGNVVWIASVVAIAACAPRKTVRNPGADNPKAFAHGTEEPSVRDDLMHPVEELKTVGFDYDSDYLDAAARAVLAANAAWLRDHGTLRVQVTGNCDERGTVPYNLALGQRRAKALRDYYMAAGVPGDRVATISYGKEKPLCSEQTEACWARNRRAETLGAYEQVVGHAGR